MSIGIYAMNEKGLAVVREALTIIPVNEIAHITTAPAKGMNDESDKEIMHRGKRAGVPTFLMAHPPEYAATLSIAAGWRWMIPSANLVVMHDSLLPRYRGFAPLITALVNGETEVGVTAFMAREEPDTGPIVTQRSIPISYPTRMREVLDRIVPLYSEITRQICETFVDGAMLTYVEQDHEKATYSVWRDELDYRIDWSWDAYRILRLIDAASDPFPGAWTTKSEHPEDHWTGEIIRVQRARVVPDLRIEDRRPGKILRLNTPRRPIVVCGSGLLEIEVDEVIPLRTRFV